MKPETIEKLSTFPSEFSEAKPNQFYHLTKNEIPTLTMGEIHPEHFYTIFPNFGMGGLTPTMDGLNLIHVIQNCFQTRDKASVMARCSIKHESQSYQK